MIERLGGPGTEPTEDEERKTKPCTETGLSARSEIASNGSHISWMDGRCEIGRTWDWGGPCKGRKIDRHTSREWFDGAHGMGSTGVIWTARRFFSLFCSVLV
jgi:hypothetical protein